MRKIKDFVYDVYYGLENVIRWAPIIWDDRDWDWTYLAIVMEYKLRRMSNHELKYGHHTTSERDGKQQLVCANLLARLIKDDYCDNAEIRFGKFTTFAFKHADAVAKNDQKYLGMLLGKNLRHWWD